MSEEFPKLKGCTLTKQINISVEPEMKEDYEMLKRLHKINVSEHIRNVIRDEIKRMKQRISAA